jgi:hypothetical protein
VGGQDLHRPRVDHDGGGEKARNEERDQETVDIEANGCVHAESGRFLGNVRESAFDLVLSPGKEKHETDPTLSPVVAMGRDLSQIGFPQTIHALIEDDEEGRIVPERRIRITERSTHARREGRRHVGEWCPCNQERRVRHRVPRLRSVRTCGVHERSSQDPRGRTGGVFDRRARGRSAKVRPGSRRPLPGIHADRRRVVAGATDACRRRRQRHREDRRRPHPPRVDRPC